MKKSKKFDEMQIAQMNEQSYLTLKYLAPLGLFLMLLITTVLLGGNALTVPVTAVAMGVAASVYIVHRVEVLKFMAGVFIAWLLAAMSLTVLGSPITNTVILNLILFLSIPLFGLSLLLTARIMQIFGYEVRIEPTQGYKNMALVRVLKILATIFVSLLLFLTLSNIATRFIAYNDGVLYDPYVRNWQIFIYLINFCIFLFIFGQASVFGFFKYVSFRVLVLKMSIGQILIGTTVTLLVDVLSPRFLLRSDFIEFGVSRIPVWLIYMLMLGVIICGGVVRFLIAKSQGAEYLDWEKRREVMMKMWNKFMKR